MLQLARSVAFEQHLLMVLTCCQDGRVADDTAVLHTKETFLAEILHCGHV